MGEVLICFFYPGMKNDTLAGEFGKSIVSCEEILSQCSVWKLESVLSLFACDNRLTRK